MIMPYARALGRGRTRQAPRRRKLRRRRAGCPLAPSIWEIHMRRILIVGAGQSGLQLGLSLLAEGYEVTIMSARTPDEIRTGWPTSTRSMFH
jgi:hypothetical protein